jgi:hypothetical protein
VTPALGTPSALVGTNITGTAANFNINGTVGATTPSTVTGTTITANTRFVGTNFDASGSGGGALRTSSSANVLQWGGGGGVNLTLDGAFNMNPANASISIAPTGTGTLTINPATAGTINNMAIGGTTPAAGAFTTLSATTAIATTSGGTGLTSFTSGGVVYASSSSALATGSALTFDGTYFGIGGTSTASPFFATKYQGLVATLDRVGDYGQSLQLIRNGVAGNAGIGLAEQNALGFYLNTTEYARLTTTGLGIGTSSPSSKLDVAGNANIKQFVSAGNGTTDGYLGYSWNRNLASGALFDNAKNAYDFIMQPGSNNLFLEIYAPGGGVVTGNALVMTPTGNLGLGVTPSAWVSTSKGLQVGDFASVSCQHNGATNVMSNAYESGTSSFTRITTGYALRYNMNPNDGVHSWYTASNTSGAISFTQAMTLDASGNLGVGNTSPSGYGKLTVGITGTATPTNATNLGPNSINLAITSSNTDVTAGVFGWQSSGPGIGSGIGFSREDGTNWGTQVRFYTHPTATTNFGDVTERARIDASGNLLVGTQSALNGTARLDVSAPSGNNVATTLKNDAGAGQWNTQIWNAGTSGDNALVQFATETSYTGRGSITYNRAGGLIAYNVTSDYRAKDISGPVTGSGALIDSIPVYMGTMKGATQERPMFIAHEVPAYAHTGEKDAVDTDGNPVYQQMDASALIPVMWAEIQSLRQRLSAANL